jgi:peptidyl-tRNA hydrolase, PTH1 family
MQSGTPREIKAIIGLGNPGKRFEHTRHNIGFMIVDTLAQDYGATWHEKDTFQYTEIKPDTRTIILLKPMTYMNDSGAVIPFLLKKGIKAEHILVVHDELELAFGVGKIRLSGSAKGHNGLRSIMEVIGKDFMRYSFGIDRPAQREDVSNYVLAPFTQDLSPAIEKAVQTIQEVLR